MRRCGYQRGDGNFAAICGHGSEIVKTVQEVAVGGWYLPHTVTCSQSEQGQEDFRRFAGRKNMWAQKETRFLHTETAAADEAAISGSLLAEKSRQLSSTLSDGRTNELSRRRRLRVDKSPGSG
ncbi:hypothetical protein D9C73_006946 [Collichthys lucidus]|uniref:Uncharacterized protein n=1 Tax=Collichthys lucidus TaxID=240159 RepID=A0A4U5UEI0_COLLU|nr:hypothetical protein D9C73_006946 [Collichthys lucidus]